MGLFAALRQRSSPGEARESQAAEGERLGKRVRKKRKIYMDSGDEEEENQEEPEVKRTITSLSVVLFPLNVCTVKAFVYNSSSFFNLAGKSQICQRQKRWQSCQTGLVRLDLDSDFLFYKRKGLLAVYLTINVFLFSFLVRNNLLAFCRITIKNNVAVT